MRTEKIHLISVDKQFPFSPRADDIMDDESFSKDSIKWDYPMVRFQQQLCTYMWSSIIDARITAKEFAPKKINPEQQNQCIEAIQSLLITAGSQNWDDEGADPVTRGAVEAALKVVKELPGDIEPPEIFADPEGNIEFDWHLDNGTMFTISVGHRGDIAISGLHSEEVRLTGMEVDNEGDPRLLLQCGLNWLIEKTQKR